MAGSFTISSSSFAIQSGAKTIGPITVTGSAQLGEVHDFTPASGANTVTVPTTATAIIIVPATTNTATLTIKGVTGDTGVAISKVNPTILSFDTSPPASFVLTAGAGAGAVEVSFI